MTVLFENSDFIAIHKPAGVSVHNDEKSVATFFPEYFTIHRLDKETSGILLLAKNKPTATELAKLFEDKKIQKTYHAIIFGNKHTTKSNQDLWSQKLSAKPGGLKNIVGPKPLSVAETKVRILKQNEYFSLLELSPLSGKTHQLRKHCALNFSPIVGDSRYALRKSNDRIVKLYEVRSMLLHAKSIVFSWDDKEVSIESPTPSYFDKLIGL